YKCGNAIVAALRPAICDGDVSAVNTFRPPRIPRRLRRGARPACAQNPNHRWLWLLRPRRDRPRRRAPEPRNEIPPSHLQSSQPYVGEPTAARASGEEGGYPAIDAIRGIADIAANWSI